MENTNNQPKPIKIAFDCDGVLVNFHSPTYRTIAKLELVPSYEMLQRIGRENQGVLDFEDFEGSREYLPFMKCHDFHEAYPETEEEVTRIVQDEFFYKILPIISDGFRLLWDVVSLFEEDMFHIGNNVEFLTARGHHLKDITKSQVLRGLENYSKIPRIGGKDLTGADYELWAFNDESVKTFGSSTAKAEYILANGFTHLIEDNPSTHLKLIAGGFPEENCFLVAQWWNRDSKGLKRMTYKEIGQSFKELYKLHSNLEE